MASSGSADEVWAAGCAEPAVLGADELAGAEEWVPVEPVLGAPPDGLPQPVARKPKTSASGMSG